nr:Lipoprotein signal peptidase [Klebsiella pneumoniae]
MSKSICSTGLRWLWVVVAVLIIDLGSKFLILQNFALGRRFRCSRRLICIMPATMARPLAFSPTAAAGSAGSFRDRDRHLRSTDGADVPFEGDAKLNNIAYALIIGGALGNLFDRLWHGFVVDMIDFYVGDWHFATFNLADSAICIGAALIVLEGFLPKPTVKEQA